MSLRVAAAVGFVVAATAATAHAQAPGEVEPNAPGMTPVIVAAPPAHESVMANRWAIGLAIGHLGITPKNATDNSQQTDFGIGELSLRYRATLHLELELAVGGGQQQMKDGTQGDLEAKTGAIALRYRFCPEGEWNWWLMGGFGGLQVAQHGSTDQQFQDSERPLGELGIGVERRFHRFALHAELRAIDVGPPKNQTMPVTGTIAPPAPSQTTQPPAPQQPSMTDSDHLSGGQLTIGASYYF